MVWNLVRLALATQDAFFAKKASEQLDFLSSSASASPSGHTMFLLALCEHEFFPPRVTVVSGENFTASELPFEISEDVCTMVLEGLTTDFPPP
ncbi:MAG: hypothetical protein ACI4XQ_04470 [Eubacteriales bacterium]